jgi:hypothetical protein
MISGSPANVLDFGADPTGVADSTLAFTTAMASNKSIYAPTGSYVLDNLFILSGRELYGDGYYNTIFIQKGNNAAINVASDPTAYPLLGQILGVNLHGFGITGKTGSTTAAFGMIAQNGGAVFNSNFDFYTYGGKRGFESFCTGSAIFSCKFNLTVVNTTETSIIINGGTYNQYSIFTSQNQSGVAVVEAVSNSIFTNLVAEGQLKLNGSRNVYINPTVELIVGTALSAGSAAIQTTGQFLTLQNPTVILDTASAAKITYAFTPFSNGIWENPTVIMNSGALANPFNTSFGFPWTLIGGGNGATNKLESIYLDNTNNNAQNLRLVTFVGDCSQWTNYQTAIGGATIQYTDGLPTNPTIQLRNTTTSMLLNYSGTVADVYINLPYFPSNGQVISFFCNKAITTFHWNPIGGGSVNGFPGNAVANSTFSVTYLAATNAWYPI